MTCLTVYIGFSNRPTKPDSGSFFILFYFKHHSSHPFVFVFGILFSRSCFGCELFRQAVKLDYHFQFKIPVKKHKQSSLSDSRGQGQLFRGISLLRVPSFPKKAFDSREPKFCIFSLLLYSSTSHGCV